MDLLPVHDLRERWGERHVEYNCLLVAIIGGAWGACVPAVWAAEAIAGADPGALFTTLAAVYLGGFVAANVAYVARPRLDVAVTRLSFRNFVLATTALCFSITTGVWLA